MKVRIVSTLAAALLISLAAGARADDKSDIRAMYQKTRQAFLKKDVKGILAQGTADFTDKEKNGKVYNAAQSKKMMEQQFAMLKSVKSCTMNPDKITVKGKTANVLSSYSMTATMVDTMGQMGPKGKTHTITMSGKSQDTLVKTAQGWKMKSMASLEDHSTVDGKPFNPAGGPPQK